MNKLEQKELLFLKKNHFTPAQKTLCKKFEQYGGTFSFEVNNKKYKLSYNQSKAYTDFLFESIKNNTGTMHKGNNVRVQDKYGKINHTENNLIKKLDKIIQK
tara:strand:+ start:43 stop:348 length:306 start_codon:yes stop_codon:yes gene_type:complete